MPDDAGANGFPSSPVRWPDARASAGNTRPSTAGRRSSASQHPPRTLPGWIHSVSTKDVGGGVPGPVLESTDDLTPASLPPPSTPRPRPPTVTSATTRPNVSRWQVFANASAYPTMHDPAGPTVDERWLVEHMPDLDASGPSGDKEGGAGGGMFISTGKRKAWYLRLQRALLRNPLVPLVLRLVVFSFSLVALGLAASVFALTHAKHFSQRPSTLMAIIFDSIALLYLLYITYDEYSSKPLGLRSPVAKMRLIWLDVFFIVFNAANLSLAFDTLIDTRGSCRNASRPGALLPPAATTTTTDGVKDNAICTRQSVLSGVLLIALFAWLLTFAVSIFRLVERVTRE
ncbi:MAG: hypothetical protein M1826_003313 [Phylliscum demangeonii]|nr:MAG: hypothetical protein M1826_003313 [Phylliscum demangeonii]